MELHDSIKYHGFFFSFSIRLGMWRSMGSMCAVPDYSCSGISRTPSDAVCVFQWGTPYSSSISATLDADAVHLQTESEFC